MITAGPPPKFHGERDNLGILGRRRPTAGTVHLSKALGCWKDHYLLKLANHPTMKALSSHADRPAQYRGSSNEELAHA
jgi:hypothetical protein